MKTRLNWLGASGWPMSDEKEEKMVVVMKVEKI